MTRKKVKLDYIYNDTARKASYKKRKKGLLKKASELTTLCGIDACALIFSPYESEPEIWPSPPGVHRVLSQFKKMPKIEQGKKMEDHSSFLRQRIAKGSDQLKQLFKDNREEEMRRIIFQSITGTPQAFLNLDMMGLNDLGWQIERQLKEINQRMKTLTGTTTPTAVAPPPNLPSDEEIPVLQQVDMMKPPSAFDENQFLNMGALPNQQWLMDMMNPQEDLGLPGGDMMFPFWG